MITDEEFVARLAQQQERLHRWGRTLGICLLVTGLLLLGWAAIQAVDNYRTQLALIESLANDRDLAQDARLKKMAVIGYRSGIIVGCGISGGFFGGALMAYHGVVLLVNPFRAQRLLVEKYRSTGAT